MCQVEFPKGYTRPPAWLAMAPKIPERVSRAVLRRLYPEGVTGLVIRLLFAASPMPIAALLQRPSSPCRAGRESAGIDPRDEGGACASLRSYRWQPHGCAYQNAIGSGARTENRTVDVGRR
jgi:hypothetical protein